MLRKGLNNLNGKFLKTRPARQYAPSACFFSKSGTKPHRNLEGPPNHPEARKCLISMGTRRAMSHRVPVNPTFLGPPLFLLHSVSGQDAVSSRRPRCKRCRVGRWSWRCSCDADRLRRPLSAVLAVAMAKDRLTGLGGSRRFLTVGGSGNGRSCPMGDGSSTQNAASSNQSGRATALGWLPPLRQPRSGAWRSRPMPIWPRT